MSAAIDINNLTFGYHKAPPLINNLSLKVAPGTRFGLFGPNGAGKTTLMSLMAGLLDYKTGTINILGKELKNNQKEINKKIGLVPQDFSFYEELTPAENMEFFGAWHGLNTATIKHKTDELLQVMGLSHVKDAALKTFSGGMKRRINLAIGVMNDPEILFLDEPTVGVDVQSRHAIIDFLKKINAEKNTTLIYTSHHLKEAETLCDEIVLIDQGAIVAHGEPKKLYQNHGAAGLEELFIQLTGKDYRD